jgi:hypothetical protein
LCKTQDPPKLRRYKKRWKVARLFAWMHNFRRLVTRWEYHIENFLGFVQLACIHMMLRRLRWKQYYLINKRIPHCLPNHQHQHLGMSIEDRTPLGRDLVLSHDHHSSA